MLRRILPFFVCPMLLLGGGCSRSYDGTVVIPRPLDVRRFWDRPPQQAQAERPQLLQTDIFPAAPETPETAAARKIDTSAAPRRKIARIAKQPPTPSSEPAKPLTCRNVSQPGKRVRMVCE
ncbi:hypothetical protein [Mesorhizobium sp.]|uniref:hypothetical protein n=1 Tax=Mesorhizobium sp. TaxID=1871066 RepID=UPI000FE2FE97|nr:hypothetical protein [Mesorhizobium sp.]RWN50338.1 MAG: hypothetical protein EOR98_32125 [Mesorhizobium sp.]RWN70730.1 MAG: hypothetical protein EOS01_32695 [Mesorhizobium sp.]RWN70810.1 MAG: hypothetical protein EOS02_32695 [Mesorhizobium sp.]RWN85264.1 MAG: hypothetical protein EOS04_23685 [Mesorhizobium sp.]RWO06655.1 MAG: hypothetical protein EOS15_33050 [Mesorhizobium sp.]